jgi:hypothetical protein
LRGFHHAELFTVLVDDANGADTDLIVDTKRSCYGCPPAKNKSGDAEASRSRREAVRDGLFFE